MRTLFRAASGRSFGLGHITRCYRLANKSTPDQFHALVYSTDQYLESKEVLLSQNFDQLFKVPAKSLDEEDAHITAAAALNADVEIVVTDICHRDIIAEPSRLISYHEMLRKEGINKIICIGDCRIPETGANLTIVPYECEGKDQPEFKLPDNTYHGLDFFVSDYKLGTARSSKINNDIASKILVCISGTDPLEVTPTILKGLQKISSLSLEVRVIVSKAMSERNLTAIQTIIGKCFNFESVDFSFNILQHILWADMAITGEGLVKYETAAAGIPTLIVSQFDHDSTVFTRFLASGAAKYLGPAEKINSDYLYMQVKELMNNRVDRNQLSKNGLALLDGMGVHRITELIGQLSAEHL